MTQNHPPVPTSLDAIDVAAPCTQSWDAMIGDARSRFCGSCRLHVYDLSAMTRDEAETLVVSRKQAGEHLCVRFVRRADGTVVTDDCGPIRRAVRRRALRLRAAAVAAFAFVFPMAGCRHAPANAEPAEEKAIDSRQILMGRTCPPSTPAPPEQPAPPTPPAPPAVSPPSDAPAVPAPPPAPPQPPRKETIGKI